MMRSFDVIFWLIVKQLDISSCQSHWSPPVWDTLMLATGFCPNKPVWFYWHRHSLWKFPYFVHWSFALSNSWRRSISRFIFGRHHCLKNVIYFFYELKSCYWMILCWQKQTKISKALLGLQVSFEMLSCISGWTNFSPYW